MSRILNIGQTSRRLRAKTLIAHITSVDTHDPFNQAMLAAEVEQTANPSQLEQFCQIPEHDDRIKILTSLGLKLDNTNSTPEQFAQLTELLFQYQDIFCSDYENLPESRLPPYKLLLTDYTPIRQKQYSLSPQQEEVLEKYVDKLLKGQVVGTSRSAWNASTILIKKAGFNQEKAADSSQWRLCLHFRKLNQKVNQRIYSIN
jgi:hypothetical protein